MQVCLCGIEAVSQITVNHVMGFVLDFGYIPNADYHTKQWPRVNGWNCVGSAGSAVNVVLSRKFGTQPDFLFVTLQPSACIFV